jgi:hypothetical protein
MPTLIASRLPVVEIALISPLMLTPKLINFAANGGPARNSPTAMQPTIYDQPPSFIADPRATKSLGFAKKQQSISPSSSLALSAGGISHGS